MPRRGSGVRTALLGVLGACVSLGAPAHAGPPPGSPPGAPPASPPVARKGALGPVTGGSFPRRHEEYAALEQHGGERALAFLVAAYRRPYEPAERGHIVSLVCDGFTGVDLTSALRAWREKDAEEADAWLWYRTLRREIGVAGPDGALAVARDGKRPPVLRAAAVRALAAWAEPALPALVREVVAGDLGKEPGRGVLLEALADALAAAPGRVGDPEAGAAFEALAPFLREDAASSRTRLALARAFARWLDTPRTTFDAAFYRALVDRRAAPTPTVDDGYGPPRFFGVEASGDRVVYVVDESGSMDEKLTADERDDLRAAASEARVGGTPHPATAAIPWDRIRTRRDAAVEFTKASIRGLPETSSFAVLLFDDGYTWVGGKPELVPATPRNVEAALKALDRTHLGGGTNLHGGLRRAFDAYVAGPARRSKAVGETVEASELARGPTTVFLLSDGAPTRDDWGFGEREPGRGAPPSAGAALAPFQETRSLVDDVARLNLFRACELHGVGIGEFAPELLDRLARLGNGKLRRIGGALGDAAATMADVRGASGSGRTARDALRAFERLGWNVPDVLRRRAEAEAREEKAQAARDAAPPAPPGVAPAPKAVDVPPVPTPEEDRATLRTGPDAALRAAAVGRLAASKHGPAIPDLTRALFEDADAGVRALCDAALRAITGRAFGWRPDLEAHELASVRRNWTWWWELHREAVEREAAAAEKRGSGPSEPRTPPAK